MLQSSHSTEVVMSTRDKKKGKDNVGRRRKSGFSISGRKDLKEEGEERERRSSASPSERKE